MMVMLWNLFHATAVADMELEPVRFVVSWIGVFLLTMLALVLASLDSINNIRVFRKERLTRRAEAREKITPMDLPLLPSADHADLS